MKIKRPKNLKFTGSLQVLLFALVILSGCVCAAAQETGMTLDVPVNARFENYQKPSAPNFETADALGEKKVEAAKSVPTRFNAAPVADEPEKTSLATERAKNGRV